ncbi:3798_t:CDS:2, partial [Funneliformis geosporum]
SRINSVSYKIKELELELKGQVVYSEQIKIMCNINLQNEELTSKTSNNWQLSDIFVKASSAITEGVLTLITAGFLQWKENIKRWYDTNNGIKQMPTLLLIYPGNIEKYLSPAFTHLGLVHGPKLTCREQLGKRTRKGEDDIEVSATKDKTVNISSDEYVYSTANNRNKIFNDGNFGI